MGAPCSKRTKILKSFVPSPLFPLPPAAPSSLTPLSQVRLRLGKALDFEFHEDSFAGLFQRREPREAGPILDIERALAKLEKVRGRSSFATSPLSSFQPERVILTCRDDVQVAIRYRRRRNRPMVLIVQNAHFIHDDDDGHSLLHMLQQRAEAWSQAGVLTMVRFPSFSSFLILQTQIPRGILQVFLTDNFHVYSHLKRSATRMHVLSIRDLTPSETHKFLSGTHPRHYPSAPPVTRTESLKVWDLIGGRLALLAKVVGREDMMEAAQDLVDEEKEWLHSRFVAFPLLSFL
jgi:hypothetical protein